VEFNVVYNGDKILNETLEKKIKPNL